MAKKKEKETRTQIMEETLASLPGYRIRVASEQFVDEFKARSEEMTKMFDLFPEFEKNDERFQIAEAEVKELRHAEQNIAGVHRKTMELLDELSARSRDTMLSVNGGRLRQHIPTNGAIDLKEKNQNHFAQKMNFYKMFLIFFIGCFAGVIIEMFYCLLQRGHFESRTALVFGPFNPVYGLGALALSAVLYKYRNRSSFFSCAGGFVVGSVIEYICSFFQELCFGSTSWDYSHMPFNLNGRICLLYSLLWGLLGIAWIKMLYPSMVQLILRVPNRIGKQLTWVLVVFMIVNCVVSSAAVCRWAERVNGRAKDTAIGRVLDERFPDERMRLIYANLTFK